MHYIRVVPKFLLITPYSIEQMEIHHHPKPEKKNFKEFRKELFIFLFMLTFHQAFTQNIHNNDIATIKSNRAASNDAITRHDVDGIAKFWLDDFVQVIGRGIYQTGKDSIIASWKALFNSNSQVAYTRDPKEITISDNDTLAWEQGEWIGIHTYSKGGNYAAMWIKRNGNWMLKAELFVSLKANKQ
jgi:ketosteroid isomerase-like protein